MSLKQAILQIHSLLESASIDHALIGGFALAVHGINRATGDIDLLVNEVDRERLVHALNQKNYRIVAESVEVLHFSGEVRLDVLLARRPISREMLERAEKTELLGSIKYLGAEDLIGLKIQAYCNDRRRQLQDKSDIQFLLKKYPDLDLKRVKFYADFFNEWPEIESLRK